MKINTITCHNVYNYGASLQAYALQQYLIDLGHEVQVINYAPQYLSFHFKLSTYISKDEYTYKPSLKYPHIKYLYVLYRYLLSLKNINRKRSFDRFTKKHLRLTRRYKNNELLKKGYPQADIYIAGSDQIWNSKYMENGKDPAFYLNFVKKGMKLSYAASFGAEGIDEEYRTVLSHWLSSFDAISVREACGQTILKTFDIESTVVCDPVFLLSKKEWEAICKKNMYKDYVLIYNIGPINSKILKDAQIIADKNKLKIISIKDAYTINQADINIEDAGPCEFISLINNATYILSNSFHATAFSIIFNKQFYTYTFNNIKNSSRMLYLLNIFGLEDHFEADIAQNRVICYSQVTLLLQKYVCKSKEWLKSKLTDR